MHQNFVLQLYWQIQFLYRTVLIGIFFLILSFWFIEFGKICQLYKMHWINQYRQTILQANFKLYINPHMLASILSCHNILWEQFLTCLFLLLWHKKLKIRLFILSMLLVLIQRYLLSIQVILTISDFQKTDAEIKFMHG